MAFGRSPLLLALMTAAACGRVNAAATKPLGPADGAGDYREHPGGPHQPAVVPSPSGEPSAGRRTDCPPRCAANGAWTGCGLGEARGQGCAGCTPTCRKGPEEGWYDCAGALIIARACGG